MSLLERIKWKGLPRDQYIRERTKKKQFYIHHTAGGPDPFSVVNWWKSTSARVATHFIIGGIPFNGSEWIDGDLVQCYNTKFWAYHLGLRYQHLAVTSNYETSRELNSESITVEVCNWGPLVYNDDRHRFETVVHDYPVADSQVVEYDEPYRGYTHYQRYTDAQLDTLRDLMIYVCDHWDMPRGYKGDSMWDIDPRAIEGDPGIWTHTSVRPDKSDCHPQPELKQVLSSL